MTQKQTSPNAAPRLIFVNRFYAPDVSATSQILSDVAEALLERGYNVEVVTSRLSYDGSETFSSSELRNGIRITRIWTTRFGRRSAIGRSIDYLSFYISVFCFLLFKLSTRDVVIAKTDPPMLSIPLGLTTRVRGATLVNWLQDLFPEVAQNLGVASSRNPLLNLLKYVRNRSLRRAQANVVIGNRMAERVIETGVNKDRVTIIHNFVDDDAVYVSRHHGSRLRKTWGFDEDDFVVGYSGNLGRAHDLDTILGAAKQLSKHEKIKFLFVGGGHLHDRLEREIQKHGLSNVSSQPYQPREKLPQVLALPNLHWASLIPSLEGCIVPSKVYGVASAGRPLLMIGDPNGEVGSLIQEYKFGECVEPGASEEAKNFILGTFKNPNCAEEMGKRARSFIDDNASMKLAFDRWETLFSRLEEIS